MGEAKRRQLAVQTQALEAIVVDTPGGRIHVQWDHGASATPNAQLTFFAEFLATTGVYDSWGQQLPLELHQSQRTQQTRCTGDMVAGDTGNPA